MHVLTVIAHPDPDSFTYQVLDRFSSGVLSAGHTHETADLYREEFDPVMTKRDLQQFENVPMPEDVLQEQARIERCDAMCWIFPMWWWGMPGLLKGWLDRVWSAGWAYKAEHDPEGSLLDPRPLTCLVPAGASIHMMNKYGFEEQMDNILRAGVFGYCGMDPIRIHFLLDCGWDTGVHPGHLETAHSAGVQVANVENYDVPNKAGRTVIPRAAS